MKKLLGSFLIFTLGAGIAGAKTVDRIIAKVNDEIITLSELQREIEPIRKQMSAQLSGAQLERELKKLEEQALNSLIEEKLIYQKAVEMEYNAHSGDKVDAYIQGVMKENNLKSTEALEEALAKEGQSLRVYREYIERKLVNQELVSSFLNSRISLLTPEIEKYYQNHLADYTTPEEVTLSEIILNTANGERDAESRAEEIAGKLQQGESFAALAGQYSKGATANKGGNIGTYLVARLNPDIKKAIANVKEGEITKPQSSAEGLVIYRVDARKPAVARPLEEVKDSIRELLFQQKSNPEYDRFIMRLKDEAYIQIFPEMQ